MMSGPTQAGTAQESSHSGEVATVRMTRRHLNFGWASLLFFLALGIVLEAMHGFKAGWYLDPPNETRRLLWTLAHAHGTLLGLVHIALAATIHVIGQAERIAAIASPCLMAASILLPGGFFLGGCFIYDTDPGLGILLTPPGAALLLVAVYLISRAVRAASSSQIT